MHNVFAEKIFKKDVWNSTVAFKGWFHFFWNGWLPKTFLDLVSLKTQEVNALVSCVLTIFTLLCVSGFSVTKSKFCLCKWSKYLPCCCICQRRKSDLLLLLWIEIRGVGECIKIFYCVPERAAIWSSSEMKSRQLYFNSGYFLEWNSHCLFIFVFQ